MIPKLNEKNDKSPYLKQFLKIKRQLIQSQSVMENCPFGKNDALEVSAKVAAAFCLENDIKADHFNNFFRYYLVEFIKKDQPDCSNLQIAIRTGMDRRLVGKVRKRAKPTKEQIVLSYLKSYCKREKTDVIKKKGLFNSFEYFCKRGANGTMTSKVLAEELLRLGHLKDLGSRYRVILH